MNDRWLFELSAEGAGRAPVEWVQTSLRPNAVRNLKRATSFLPAGHFASIYAHRYDEMSPEHRDRCRWLSDAISTLRDYEGDVTLVSFFADDELILLFLNRALVVVAGMRLASPAKSDLEV